MTHATWSDIHLVGTRHYSEPNGDGAFGIRVYGVGGSHSICSALEQEDYPCQHVLIVWLALTTVHVLIEGSYRQQKYNLLHEETEGYAKLVTEVSAALTKNPSEMHLRRTLDIISSLIGMLA